MRHLSPVVLILAASSLLAQTSAPVAPAPVQVYESVPSSSPALQPSPVVDPQSYANFSIMLIPNQGVGVVLMHNPRGDVEYIPVTSIKASIDAGYVAVRAAELASIIQSLSETNAKLSAENDRLRNAQPGNVPTSVTVTSQPSQAELDLQREAMRRSDEQARRQQLLQVWMGMRRPPTQNINVNVTDCTKYPALCVAR